VKPVPEPSIRVSLSEFDKDPKHWIRQASTERMVLVYHDGTERISCAFGGSLNTSPTGDDRSLTDEDLAVIREMVRDECGKAFEALGDRLCACIDGIETRLRGEVIVTSVDPPNPPIQWVR
jgi:hypothetical protein